MKTYRSISILMGMASMLVLLSCDKTDLQNPKILKSSDSIPIDLRSECTECPGLEECCCVVYLQDIVNGYANLRFCGTSDGQDVCSGDAVGNCNSFSGGGQDIELDPPNSRQRFCMNEGDDFWVANIDPAIDAYIYITCQDDLLNPVTIQVMIPVGYRFYYHVNGSCEVEPCT